MTGLLSVINPRSLSLVAHVVCRRAALDVYSDPFAYAIVGAIINDGKPDVDFGWRASAISLSRNRRLITCFILRWANHRIHDPSLRLLSVALASCASDHDVQVLAAQTGPALLFRWRITWLARAGRRLMLLRQRYFWQQRRTHQNVENPKFGSN